MTWKIFKDFLVFYPQPSKTVAEKNLYDLQKKAKNKAFTQNTEQLVLIDKIQDAYIFFLENDKKSPFLQEDLQLCRIFAQQTLLPADIARQNYESLNIHNKYRPLLGTVALPFSLMIAGLPGSGKTSFFLMMMNDLAKNNPNKKILFVSNEERQSPALAQKIKRFGLDCRSNIYIVEEHIKMWHLFDFVFIDSVNSLNISLEMSKEQIKTAEKTKKTSATFFKPLKPDFTRAHPGLNTKSPFPSAPKTDTSACVKIDSEATETLNFGSFFHPFKNPEIGGFKAHS